MGGDLRQHGCFPESAIGWVVRQWGDYEASVGDKRRVQDLVTWGGRSPCEKGMGDPCARTQTQAQNRLENVLRLERGKINTSVGGGAPLVPQSAHENKYLQMSKKR